MPGQRTRESALDTFLPANRSAAVSPMGGRGWGRGGAQGPQPGWKVAWRGNVRARPEATRSRRARPRLAGIGFSHHAHSLPGGSEPSSTPHHDGHSRCCSFSVERPLFRPDISQVATDRASVVRCCRSLPLAIGRCCCCHRCCQARSWERVAGRDQQRRRTVPDGDRPARQRVPAHTEGPDGLGLLQPWLRPSFNPRVQTGLLCRRARSVPERGRHSGHSEALTGNANVG